MPFLAYDLDLDTHFERTAEIKVWVIKGAIACTWFCFTLPLCPYTHIGPCGALSRHGRSLAFPKPPRWKDCVGKTQRPEELQPIRPSAALVSPARAHPGERANHSVGLELMTLISGVTSQEVPTILKFLLLFLPWALKVRIWS